MNRCIQSFWRAQRIVKPYTNCSYVSFVAHIPTSALQPLPLWLYRLLTMRLLWQDDLLLPLVGLRRRRVEPAA